MPKPNKPKKAYPNSDRFAGDGRRRAYDAAEMKKPVNRRKRQRRLLVLAGTSVAAIVSTLLYLIAGASKDRNPGRSPCSTTI